MNPNVLEISNLKVSFFGDDGETRAVNDVCLEIPRGKITALVGESGCGKSVTSYSILRLIQKPGRITGGKIIYHGADGKEVDLAALSEKDPALYQVRGDRISMIFQEPMTALSPVHTVGDQLTEILYEHRKISRKEAEEKTIQMLGRVGIPAPERRFRQYPFELSGGMRQRVVIAMAMLTEPELLIADEPTTALDVTIQAQVLFLMKELQKETGNSILLITHDLAVVAQMADYVSVMYLGRIVEKGNVVEIIKDPRHPYTKGLLDSLPGLHGRGEPLPSIRGSVPSLLNIPPGCPFHPRCNFAKAGLCDCGAPPPEKELAGGRKICCHRAEEMTELFAKQSAAGGIG
ncbi:MAG: ABC transporter ATP-binding protein [Lentisphaeria bacterium]|nr:ABC transporter ATP-binding protein [Lentisphaeria bacterium]